MSDPITICMTIPALDGRCWVFIDPSRPDFAFNREFATADQAADYARGLAKTTGWPIDDAAGVQSAQLPSVPFDDRQARVNEVLWLMSAVAQQDRIDWKDPAFWAEAAKQNAEIIVDAGLVLTDEDHVVLLEIGAGMLRQGAADLGVSNVDDVLAATITVSC